MALETLASEQSFPIAVTFAGGRVYWLVEQQPGVTPNGPSDVTAAVMTVSFDRTHGWTAPRVAAVADHGQELHVIASDATAVYWATSDGRILKLSHEGGTPSELVSGWKDASPSSVGPVGIGSMVISGIDLFFSRCRPSEPCRIVRQPLTGAPPQDVVDAPMGVLAVDAAWVYVTTSDGVARAPRGGGALTTLVSGVQPPCAIAVDADSVFWTYAGSWTIDSPNGDGAVMSAPAVGGPAITVAAGLTAPCGIVADRGALHVAPIVGMGGLPLITVPRGGGAPTTFYAPAGGPDARTQALAADATSIVFVTRDSVLRAGK